MEEQEYLKAKKKLSKQLDEAFKKAMKKEISVEEYFKLKYEWNQLIKDAQKEQWFKHI